MFMTKRSDKCRDEHFRWDFGSGQVEFGEQLEEAVLRELKEEYGCEGKIVMQLPAHSIPRVWDGKKTHWVACPFLIVVRPQDIQIMEPEKVVEHGWFPFDSLPEPLHSGVQQTLKKVENQLRLALQLSEGEPFRQYVGDVL